jgi:hypothetical protein
LKILIDPLGGFDERFLNDVIGIDPCLQTSIHPRLDHAPQAIPAFAEQRIERIGMALPDAFNQLHDFAGGGCHRKSQ